MNRSINWWWRSDEKFASLYLLSRNSSCTFPTTNNCSIFHSYPILLDKLFIDFTRFRPFSTISTHVSSAFRAIQSHFFAVTKDQTDGPLGKADGPEGFRWLERHSIFHSTRYLKRNISSKSSVKSGSVSGREEADTEDGLNVPSTSRIITETVTGPIWSITRRERTELSPLPPRDRWAEWLTRFSISLKL